MKPNKYLDDVFGGGKLKSFEVLVREETLNKKIELLNEYLKLEPNGNGVISGEISRLKKEMDGLESIIKSKRLGAEGKAFLDEKEYGKAIRKLNEAIELNPNNAVYFNDRGNAYEQKWKFFKAHADFKRAKQLADKK